MMIFGFFYLRRPLVSNAEIDIEEEKDNVYEEKKIKLTRAMASALEMQPSLVPGLNQKTEDLKGVDLSTTLNAALRKSSDHFSSNALGVLELKRFESIEMITQKFSVLSTQNHLSEKIDLINLMRHLCRDQEVKGCGDFFQAQALAPDSEATLQLNAFAAYVEQKNVETSNKAQLIEKFKANFGKSEMSSFINEVESNMKKDEGIQTIQNDSPDDFASEVITEPEVESL